MGCILLISLVYMDIACSNLATAYHHHWPVFWGAIQEDYGALYRNLIIPGWSD